jgi:hypothetical protein
VQNSRNPLRCQPITVSGFTMSRGVPVVTGSSCQYGPVA